MKQLVIIKEHNLGCRTSVHGNYEYEANYCITTKNESMLRKRGFHIRKDELENLLHNIPEEFKDCIRTVKDDSELEFYVEKIEAPEVDETTKEEFKEAVKDFKEASDEEKDEEKDETEEFIEDVEIAEKEAEDGPMLITDIPKEVYSKYSKEETAEFRIKLKEYAKELGVNIHPALKDITKIINKIREQ